MRQRVSTRELSCPMSLDKFRQADYGQVCQFLGLRPSKPYANAQGEDTRRRRRRPRRQEARS